MAKSTLQKLYDGEIYPFEEIGVDTPEYRRAMKALTDEKDNFAKTLSESNRESFEKIEDLHDEIAKHYGYADFAHGFRLAVALIFDSQNITDSIARCKDE